jgi:hypothetical protein
MHRVQNHAYSKFDTDQPIPLQRVSKLKPSLLIKHNPDATLSYVFLKRTKWFKMLGMGLEDRKEFSGSVFENLTIFSDCRAVEVSQLLWELSVRYHFGEIKIEEMPHEKYISSDFVRKWIMSFLGPLNPVCHGPAAQVIFDMTIESGYPEADFTPKIASEWITRPRVCDWPTRALIKEVVKCGFGATPVCHDEKAEMADYEWRISFSDAEIKLFKTMEFERCVFYTVIKIFIYDNIDKELFKSYYVKNLYFWFMEKVPSAVMYRQNFGTLLIQFFNETLFSLSEKRISHYFIPSINLIGDMTNSNFTKIYSQITKIQKSLFSKIYCLIRNTIRALSPNLPPWESNSIFESDVFEHAMSYHTSDPWKYVSRVYTRPGQFGKIGARFEHLIHAVKGVNTYYKFLHDIGQSMSIIEGFIMDILFMHTYLELNMSDPTIFNLYAHLILFIHTIEYLFLKSNGLDINFFRFPPVRDIIFEDSYEEGDILSVREKKDDKK